VVLFLPASCRHRALRQLAPGVRPRDPARSATGQEPVVACSKSRTFIPFPLPPRASTARSTSSRSIRRGETLAISVKSIRLLQSGHRDFRSLLLIPSPPGKIAGSVRFQAERQLSDARCALSAVPTFRYFPGAYDSSIRCYRPAARVGETLRECIRYWNKTGRRCARIEIRSLVSASRSQARRVREYPHQLSALRQRVMIADGARLQPETSDRRLADPRRSTSRAGARSWR